MKMRRFVIGVLVVAWVTGAAVGQERYARRTPIVEAFERNRDAVVSISSAEVRAVQDDFFTLGHNWPFGRQRLALVPSLGSGFIVDGRGYIVTNTHVVKRAVQVTIVMAGGEKTYEAKIVQMDEASDVALLKIEADEPLPTVQLGHSDDLMIGETVMAIGNPFGYQLTLTDGVISAIHRDLEFGDEIELRDLIQVSAAINPGSSGGPLLNINGEVIGMNTAIRKAAEGIGFSIPVDKMREALGSMLNIDRLRRIDFGVEVSVGKDAGERAELAGGLAVRRVWPGSAAEKAGLKVGDVLRKIDGRKLRSELDFLLHMLEAPEGKKVKLEVTRGTDKTYRFAITLRRRGKPDGEALAESLFGIKLGELTTAAIKKYAILAESGDVVVRAVEADSPGAYAGIEPGDVLVTMNGKKVRGLEDVGLGLELLGEGVAVEIVVHRTERGRWRYVAVPYRGTLRTRKRAD